MAVYQLGESTAIRRRMPFRLVSSTTDEPLANLAIADLENVTVTLWWPWLNASANGVGPVGTISGAKAIYYYEATFIDLNNATGMLLAHIDYPGAYPMVYEHFVVDYDPQTAETAEDIRVEMDTNSTKLVNLDAAISSRLAAASYAAPDNAGIAALVARVTAARATLLDNLVALDAAISSRAAAVDLTAVKGKTDQLTFSTPNMVDSAIKRIAAAGVQGSGVKGDKWRPA